jgi:hypothetical protein
MKLSPHVLAALILQTASASAVEQIVTLGDSLTFAYEAEFGFQVDLFFVRYGDGFSSRVRNWAEILNDPIYRHERFDLGTRQNISVLGLYDMLMSSPPPSVC